jgi:hypothetical protein
MRRQLALACAVSALLAAAPSGRQARDAAIALPPTGTATVSGVVVTDEANGQPVRKARVTLNSVISGLPGRTVTTDDAGRFVFGNVAAGRFNLAAAKPGYLNANYGAKLQDRPGTSISVAAGQQIAGLIMRMAHGGVITGVVRDQNGQPAFGVGVSVLRYGYFVLTGERSLGSYSSGGSGGADDRGVYRAYGLPPGEYVVMVTANFGMRPGDEIERQTQADIQRGRLLISAGRSGMPGTAAGGGAVPPLPPSPRVTFAPVYFPGVTDVSLATSITLGVGEERSGVDLQVQLVPTARVEGTVKLPDGIAPASVVVTIASNGPMAGWVSGPQQSKRLDSAGRFVMTGVAPGSYSIKARPSGSLTPGASPGIAPTSYWAQSDVVVDGHDQQVAMELQPGMAITGRLAFEGVTPPPADLAGVRVTLVPPGSGANLSAGPSGGTTDAAGKFSFLGVAPDRFRLTYMSTAQLRTSWTLKSAVVAGKDMLDSVLEVQPGTDVEMVVTFTDHPSELTGTLQDTSGRAAPDYFIIVFAADRTFWTPASRRVRMIRPGNDGQFSLTGLPPGEYRVAALTDVINGEWYNPTFLEGLLPASIKVGIGEGQKTTQNLKIGGG